MFEAKVIADSVSSVTGCRITTLSLTFPRYILAEFNTHRAFSRNAASSRAIPLSKMLDRVKMDPVVPVFKKNKPGMQSEEDLTSFEQISAKSGWLEALNNAVRSTAYLSFIHKQWVNRLIEPWLWVTVVVTATEWDNFFALRCHKDAQPEFQIIAQMAYVARDNSKPVVLYYGEWHLPYVTEDDIKQFYGDTLSLIKISVGRCTRVSYLNHEGVRDPQEDIALHDKLIVSFPKHVSPAEHQAQCLEDSSWIGNFKGWFQYRKTLKGECIDKFTPLPETLAIWQSLYGDGKPITIEEAVRRVKKE